MRTSLGVAGALLPFAVLFSAFLIFKLDALRASLSAWIVEFVLVLAFYHMPLSEKHRGLGVGKPDHVAGFLVLYTGQIFGQAYRNTGLLEILLESIQSMLPSWDLEGQAVALVTLVGGFIGAFNGFATYPVTIPGLVDIGFDGVSATRAIWSIFPGRCRSTAFSSRRIFPMRQATCRSWISCAWRGCLAFRWCFFRCWAS